MFRMLAQLVCRAPWICILLWIGMAVLTGLLAPDKDQLHLSEPASLLPPDSPLNTAMRFYAEAFPDQAARSRVVLVFERPTGITPDDRNFLKTLAQRLQREGRTGTEPWRVWSAETNPELGLRLNSADGQASMIVVGLDVNYITKRAAAVVEQVEKLARSELPLDLSLEVTGSAGIGREHNTRAQAALKRTTKVTITAVLIILALVYRSPLGALVPLVSIGISVFIAFRVLDFLALAGWSISEAERTFTVVLLFGAGTDYALFWISRYREELSGGRSRVGSAVDAMVRVGPAILASAGTTILGLTMLIWADMVIIHNSGKVLGIVLLIALLAAITLTPAVTILMGNAFFWPGSPASSFSVGQRHVWPKLAKDVVRRPYVVFFGGLFLIGLPAIRSANLAPKYDSFGEVPKGSSAERGLALAKAHFSEDELFSTRFLIESADFGSDARRARSASDELAARIAAVDGVSDVWHLGAPAGGRRGGELATLLNSLPGGWARDQVAGHYFAEQKNVLQLEVMQQHPPLSPEAVAVFKAVQNTIDEWARQTLPMHIGTGSGALPMHIGTSARAGKEARGPLWSIHAVGLTPYIEDVKNLADADWARVIWLVIGVIWLIVVAVIRRVRLAIFMLVATLITYAAALGLTGWLFVDILGRSGVDYKVRILLFVVIVAVGQDYNIFLVTRMLEEIKSFDLNEAITRSVILTGPIISSCGLIMAATLGSLSSTGIDLTEQLGFACAVGILLDTFLVRPLLIPSFYLISESRWRPSGHSTRRDVASGNSQPPVPAHPNGS